MQKAVLQKSGYSGIKVLTRQQCLSVQATDSWSLIHAFCVSDDVPCFQTPNSTFANVQHPDTHKSIHATKYVQRFFLALDEVFWDRSLLLNAFDHTQYTSTTRPFLVPSIQRKSSLQKQTMHTPGFIQRQNRKLNTHPSYKHKCNRVI